MNNKKIKRQQRGKRVAGKLVLFAPTKGELEREGEVKKKGFDAGEDTTQARANDGSFHL